jgi:hypothetical protein
MYFDTGVICIRWEKIKIHIKVNIIYFVFDEILSFEEFEKRRELRSKGRK